jgi:hypothetical protein
MRASLASLRRSDSRRHSEERLVIEAPWLVNGGHGASLSLRAGTWNDAPPGVTHTHFGGRRSACRWALLIAEVEIKRYHLWHYTPMLLACTLGHAPSSSTVQAFLHEGGRLVWRDASPPVAAGPGTADPMDQRAHRAHTAAAHHRERVQRPQRRWLLQAPPP